MIFQNCPKIAYLFLLFFSVGTLFAQQQDNALLNFDSDNQLVVQQDQEILMIWRITDQTFTERAENSAELIEFFKTNYVFLVAAANSENTSNYVFEKEITNSQFKLSIPNGNSILASQTFPSSFEDFKLFCQPMFENYLGEMGKHLEFKVFPKTTGVDYTLNAFGTKVALI